MNEQTQQALNAFVQQAISAAQAGAAWTAEQAPLLVQEWLRWRLIEGTLTVAGLLVASIGCGFVSRWGWRRLNADADESLAFMAALTGALGCPLLFIAAAGNILPTVKVLVAPRVAVIEQLGQWLK